MQHSILSGIGATASGGECSQVRVDGDENHDCDF